MQRHSNSKSAWSKTKNENLKRVEGHWEKRNGGDAIWEGTASCRD
jgi:hypothetical protein